MLILKEEAGRKDKIFLYDSQGDEQTFHNDRYSPVPRRVQPFKFGLIKDGSRFGSDNGIYVRRNSIIVQRNDDKDAFDSNLKRVSSN